MAYQGFDKLKSTLASEPGVRNPAGLAASIGRKKYGPKAMSKAAATGVKLGKPPTAFGGRSFGGGR